MSRTREGRSAGCSLAHSLARPQGEEHAIARLVIGHTSGSAFRRNRRRRGAGRSLRAAPGRDDGLRRTGGSRDISRSPGPGDAGVSPRCVFTWHPRDDARWKQYHRDPHLGRRRAAGLCLDRALDDDGGSAVERAAGRTRARGCWSKGRGLRR